MEKYYKYVKNNNFDGWQLILQDHIKQKLEDPTLFLKSINLIKKCIDSHDIVEIKIKPHYQPIFSSLYSKSPQFYIRQLSSSNPLYGKKILNYIRYRWSTIILE